MATTGMRDHVLIFLENDVPFVVKIEDGDSVEFSGCTAGFGHSLWLH